MEIYSFWISPGSDVNCKHLRASYKSMESMEIIFHSACYLLLLLLVGQRTNKGQRAATTESMREVQKKAKASQS